MALFGLVENKNKTDANKWEQEKKKHFKLLGTYFVFDNCV